MIFLSDLLKKSKEAKKEEPEKINLSSFALPIKKEEETQKINLSSFATPQENPEQRINLSSFAQPVEEPKRPFLTRLPIIGPAISLANTIATNSLFDLEKVSTLAQQGLSDEQIKTQIKQEQKTNLGDLIKAATGAAIEEVSFGLLPSKAKLDTKAEKVAASLGTTAAFLADVALTAGTFSLGKLGIKKILTNKGLIEKGVEGGVKLTTTAMEAAKQGKVSIKALKDLVDLTNTDDAIVRMTGQIAKDMIIGGVAGRSPEAAISFGIFGGLQRATAPFMGQAGGALIGGFGAGFAAEKGSLQDRIDAGNAAFFATGGIVGGLTAGKFAIKGVAKGTVDVASLGIVPLIRHFNRNAAIKLTNEINSGEVDIGLKVQKALDLARPARNIERTEAILKGEPVAKINTAIDNLRTVKQYIDLRIKDPKVKQNLLEALDNTRIGKDSLQVNGEFLTNQTGIKKIIRGLKPEERVEVTSILDNVAKHAAEAGQGEIPNVDFNSVQSFKNATPIVQGAVKATRAFLLGVREEFGVTTAGLPQIEKETTKLMRGIFGKTGAAKKQELGQKLNKYIVEKKSKDEELVAGDLLKFLKQEVPIRFEKSKETLKIFPKELKGELKKAKQFFPRERKALNRIEKSLEVLNKIKIDVTRDDYGAPRRFSQAELNLDEEGYTLQFTSHLKQRTLERPDPRAERDIAVLLDAYVAQGLKRKYIKPASNKFREIANKQIDVVRTKIDPVSGKEKKYRSRGDVETANYFRTLADFLDGKPSALDDTVMKLIASIRNSRTPEESATAMRAMEVLNGLQTVGAMGFSISSPLLNLTQMKNLLFYVPIKDVFNGGQFLFKQKDVLETLAFYYRFDNHLLATDLQGIRTRLSSSIPQEVLSKTTDIGLILFAMSEATNRRISLATGLAKSFKENPAMLELLNKGMKGALKESDVLNVEKTLLELKKKKWWQKEKKREHLAKLEAAARVAEKPGQQAELLRKVLESKQMRKIFNDALDLVDKTQFNLRAEDLPPILRSQTSRAFLKFQRFTLGQSMLWAQQVNQLGTHLFGKQRDFSAGKKEMLRMAEYLAITHLVVKPLMLQLGIDLSEEFGFGETYIPQIAKTFTEGKLPIQVPITQALESIGSDLNNLFNYGIVNFDRTTSRLMTFVPAGEALKRVGKYLRTVEIIESPEFFRLQREKIEARTKGISSENLKRIKEEFPDLFKARSREEAHLIAIRKTILGGREVTAAEQRALLKALDQARRKQREPRRAIREKLKLIP